MSAVAIVTAPAGESLLCLMGGLSRCADGGWTSSARMRCTGDVGRTWKTYPDLAMPVAGATFVQGPFGSWLVGGLTLKACSGQLQTEASPSSAPVVPPQSRGLSSPALASAEAAGLQAAGGATADWRGGIQSIVWDEEGKNALRWAVERSAAPGSPVGLTYHVLATWSWEKEALYITGGVRLRRPEEFMALLLSGQPIRGEPEVNRELWRVDFTPFDARNSTGSLVGSNWQPSRVPSTWTRLEDAPSVIVDVTERSGILTEFITDGRGWVRYLPEYVNVSQRPYRPQVQDNFAALGYMTTDRIYNATDYGVKEWLMLRPYVHPRPSFNDNAQVRMRALVLFTAISPRLDELDDGLKAALPNTVGIAGMVWDADEDRSLLVGKHVKVYPSFPCQRAPCAANQGKFSLGCKETPWDAACFPCEQAPKCIQGDTFEMSGCGENILFGSHPGPPMCKACSACSSPLVPGLPCRGKNDTLCVLPQGYQTILQKTYALIIDYETALALDIGGAAALLVCAVAGSIRWLASRQGKLCTQRHFSARVQRQTVSISKTVQYAALMVLSTLLVLCTLVLQLSLAAALLQSPSIPFLHAHTMWALPAVGLLCQAAFLAFYMPPDEEPHTLAAVCGNYLIRLLRFVHPRSLVLIQTFAMREAASTQGPAFRLDGQAAGRTLALNWLKAYTVCVDIVMAGACFAAELLYFPADAPSVASTRFACTVLYILVSLSHLANIACSVHVVQLASTRLLMMSISALTGMSAGMHGEEDKPVQGLPSSLHKMSRGVPTSLPTHTGRGTDETGLESRRSEVVTLSPLALSTTTTQNRSTRVAVMQCSTDPPFVASTMISGDMELRNEGEKHNASVRMLAHATSTSSLQDVSCSDRDSLTARGRDVRQDGGTAPSPASVESESNLSESDVAMLAAMFAAQLKQTREQGRPAEQLLQIEQALARMHLLASKAGDEGEQSGESHVPT